MRSIYFIIIVVSTSVACKPKEKDCNCHCFDSNGAVVIDTVFHATSDMAYQQCEGLESNTNVADCAIYE